ncbi:hypothetical protein [Streptomyces sp. bgisy100]|uniref:hypothetical protein n=1 Tax=Streptomyces sp. bgisy100 TaxID=3413783 RepID=UPI003D73B28B
MSASFAMPAAVRLPRTVAARRALLVVLFLGGLLGLAFLFGGSAQAADLDGSSGRATVLAPAEQAGGQAKSRMQDRRDRMQDRMAEGAEKSAERRKAVEDAVSDTVEPVAQRTERAARPVAEPVTGLVERTADAARLPAGLPGGDGQDGSGAQPDTREPHRPGQDASEQAHHAPVNTAGPAVRTAEASQQYAADATERAESAGAAQHHDRLPVDLPQAPLSSGSAAQNAGSGSGPRGGDAHAAPATDAPRFGLVAGAVQAAHGAPTRERSHDILEFPG